MFNLGKCRFMIDEHPERFTSLGIEGQETRKQTRIHKFYSFKISLGYLVDHEFFDRINCSRTIINGRLGTKKVIQTEGFILYPFGF